MMAEPKRIWIWRDCEPLPIDPGNPRLMRAGMLSEVLAQRGHQVHWFISTFDHYQKRTRIQQPGTYRLDNGVAVELVAGIGYGNNGSPRRLVHNAIVASRFVSRAKRTIARDGSPEIIVADLPMPDSALAGVRLARRLGIPSVVSIRDLWPDFFKTFLSPAKAILASPFIANIDRVSRAACREADQLIGISDGYLGWGLEKAGRARKPTDAIVPLGYAPPGLRDTATGEHALRAKGIDLTKKLATFIGSWGRTYDLELVADVARILSARDDIQFVVAGKGEMGAMFEERARQLPNIVTPGWLDRDEISLLLSRSSVALGPYTPSAPQGLPNKIFEYMAAGLFQVTTLGEEARDVLDRCEGGIIVEPGNAEQFATAVQRGIELGSTQENRKRIRLSFAERFDADKVYADYADLIEETVLSWNRRQV